MCCSRSFTGPTRPRRPPLARRGAARTRSDTDHTDRFRRCDRQVCDAFGDRDKRTGNPPRPRQQSGRDDCEPIASSAGSPARRPPAQRRAQERELGNRIGFGQPFHLIDEVGDRQRCGRGHGSLPDSRAWRENRKITHECRARTRSQPSVSLQLSAYSPRLCRPLRPYQRRSLIDANQTRAPGLVV